MLKGKTALVTGSTQGLGLAIAERLAAEGCNVMLNGFGKPDAIEADRQRIEADHGVRALHHGADLADPAQIAALVEAAFSAFGGVGNDAGTQLGTIELIEAGRRLSAGRPGSDLV